VKFGGTFPGKVGLALATGNQAPSCIPTYNPVAILGLSYVPSASIDDRPVAAGLIEIHRNVDRRLSICRRRASQGRPRGVNRALFLRYSSPSAIPQDDRAAAAITELCRCARAKHLNLGRSATDVCVTSVMTSHLPRARSAGEF